MFSGTPIPKNGKSKIDEKISQLSANRYGAYLRKMAIDRYIIQVDTIHTKEMTKALASIDQLIPVSSSKVYFCQSAGPRAIYSPQNPWHRADR